MVRFTEAWYVLPGGEQQHLLGQVQNALDQVGGRSVILCDCSWSAEQWPYFGVEEFPDLAALQRHQQLLAELNWARYTESMTLLGTEFRG